MNLHVSQETQHVSQESSSLAAIVLVWTLLLTCLYPSMKRQTALNVRVICSVEPTHYTVMPVMDKKLPNPDIVQGAGNALSPIVCYLWYSGNQIYAVFELAVVPTTHSSDAVLAICLLHKLTTTCMLNLYLLLVYCMPNLHILCGMLMLLLVAVLAVCCILDRLPVCDKHETTSCCHSRML